MLNVFKETFFLNIHAPTSRLLKNMHSKIESVMTHICMDNKIPNFVSSQAYSYDTYESDSQGVEMLKSYKAPYLDKLQNK